MEFLDMNDHCLEHVLKYCDADTLVDASQTCKKLREIAAPLYKYQTSYHCMIRFKKVEDIVKRTIASIGKHLTQLKFCTSTRWRPNNTFIRQLLRKCPNLQILHLESNVSINWFFDSCAQNCQHLEHLFINNFAEDDMASSSSIISFGCGLKQLQSLEVHGRHWNKRMICDFLGVANSLKRFSCFINGSHQFQIDNDFLERFRSSANQWSTLTQLYADRGIVYDLTPTPRTGTNRGRSRVSDIANQRFLDTPHAYRIDDISKYLKTYRGNKRN